MWWLIALGITILLVLFFVWAGMREAISPWR